MYMQAIRLFRGHILNSAAEDRYALYTDEGLVVDGSGIILEVGAYHEIHQQYPSAAIVGCSDRLILPGFIDTHAHLPQFGAVALYGKELRSRSIGTSAR